ncbi:hypothetical protein NDU88_002895 [Pleurodeles waltl]|uniref:Uncharacterized protein n=1 Tax=Pleurodeles waltl TaxID=8319 RepID=A0AAV7MQY9_PLEWA|nr:hypothetical protein NDU88_002895 [Pleurodeles waltl]
MGTPSALLTRFPVSRETLEHIRNTEEGKRRACGQPGEREEREKEDVQRAETEEQNIEYIEEPAEGGDTNEKGPEPENPGASHDPGGSWLTKVRSILGTGEFKFKKTLRKGNGELGKTIKEGAQG